MTSPNPFAAHGTIASGARFVGRAEELGWLRRRLYEGRSSAALVGLAHIGKSSVASRVIDDPPDGDTITDWITVTGFQSGADLLRRVLASCTSVAPAAPGAATSFLSTGSQNDAAPPTIYELHNKIKEGLLRLRKSGRYLVIALDEFDSIRNFADARELLILLRELVYHPEHMPMAVLTVARRPLELIEVEVANISTFAGVCESNYLGPMTYGEVGGMAGRSAELPADAPDIAWMHTGGQPYLTEIIFSRILEHGIANIERFIESDIAKYYAKIEAFMRKEKLWEPLLALALGPAGGPNADQTALIRRYGLVDADGRVLSADFAMFLKARRADTGQ